MPTIWCNAQNMIERYGPAAATHADLRADLLLRDGDLQGSAEWYAIRRAILFLLNRRNVGPEPLLN